MDACCALYIRCRLGIAGLSAKNASSGSAGVLPSSTRARSPRRPIQSGSPTGATAPSPSSAPRSTMTRRRRSAPRGDSAGDGENSWSPPLEFSRHEQERQRLLAAFGAAHGLLHLG